MPLSILYICFKGKNKIVPNVGKADVFHSHKITWKQYLENGEFFVSCSQLLHLSRATYLIF